MESPCGPRLRGDARGGDGGVRLELVPRLKRERLLCLRVSWPLPKWQSTIVYLPRFGGAFLLKAAQFCCSGPGVPGRGIDSPATLGGPL
jgi:hypothetical protein